MNSSSGLPTSSSPIQSQQPSTLISPQKQSAASATAAALQQQQQYQYAYAQQQQSSANGVHDNQAYQAALAQAQSQQQQLQQQQQQQQQQLNLISQVGSHMATIREDIRFVLAAICRTAARYSTADVLYDDRWSNDLSGRRTELPSRPSCTDHGIDHNHRSTGDVLSRPGLEQRHCSAARISIPTAIGIPTGIGCWPTSRCNLSNDHCSIESQCS